MNTQSDYRIVGDIKVTKKTPMKSVSKNKVDVAYGGLGRDFNDVAIIQTRKPLTPDAPYFLVNIHKCGKYIRYNNLQILLTIKTF